MSDTAESPDCPLSAPVAAVEGAALDELARALRSAAQGRTEYAETSRARHHHDDAVALAHEADAFTIAAQLVESGDIANFLRNTCPSWRWRALGVDMVP